MTNNDLEKEWILREVAQVETLKPKGTDQGLVIIGSDDLVKILTRIYQQGKIAVIGVPRND